MRIGYALLGVLFSIGVFADTLTLKNGRVVTGTYLGGTARQVRMEVGDRIETFQVSDVAEIQFQGAQSANAPAPAPAPAAPTSSLPRREPANVFRPDSTPAPAASAAAKAEIPAGSTLTVRMIDSVDSEVNSVGEEFRASLDEPVMVNGDTVIPRGANVVAKLVDDKQSGKLTGRTELTLDLVSVEVAGKMVDINTGEVTQQSESRTGKTARNVGGGAALGAIIGAIAGGGKGAAIGATAGAGAGAAVQVLTKGQRVRIPSETRLTFTLQNAVRI